MGVEGVLVCDGISRGQENHVVLVKAPPENDLLGSKRTRVWFQHRPKKGLKGSKVSGFG